MSSFAKKIDSPQNSQNDESLSSFQHVIAAITSSDYFSNFQKEINDQGYIFLRDDNANIALLSDSLWLDKDKLLLFRQKNDASSFSEICLCTKDNLEEKSSLPHTKELRFFILPLSLYQLHLYIEGTKRLHNAISKTKVAKSNIGGIYEDVRDVLNISKELNSERDTEKLLSLILQKARDVCNADSGSIYIIAWEDYKNRIGSAKFKLAQNATITEEHTQFEVPITKDTPVGYASIYGTSINIPDLYRLDTHPEENKWGFKHDKTWDLKSNYQCRSLLTLPMFDISNEVIGVIQLINRRRAGVTNLSSKESFEKDILPFDDKIAEYTEIISHQAGIALENALLTEEREDLFEGFVHASMAAIEQRDPTTSGHSVRVARLTLETAHLINNLTSGPYKDIRFTEGELKELEYASLLHDFGKIGVREKVLTKAKKLYPWEKEIVLERFASALTSCEISYLEDVIKYIESPDTYPPGFNPETIHSLKQKSMDKIQEYLDFILKCNEPTVLEQGGFELLRVIASTTFLNPKKEERYLINEKELKALSVSRGSLTRDEFDEIQSHVTRTYEFLRKIPWGSNFKNLPQIAAKHHEKLDGSGYPTHAAATEIPIQTRIMTISDIFDALTASDRPYKKAVPVEKAMNILEMEVNGGKCDSELFKIFYESEVYKKVI